jgi:hypothetical protein
MRALHEEFHDAAESGHGAADMAAVVYSFQP